MWEDIIKHTLMITSFVLVMMTIIEYVNVQTRGKWSKPLKKSKGLQIIVAAIFGAIPGCLGTYTIVSLYTHNLVNFGALVTAMIATSGDEAFIMFSMMPEKAIILTLIILGVAIATGFLVNIFIKKKTFAKDEAHMEIHEEESSCKCYSRNQIIGHLKNISFHRAVIIFGSLIFIFLLSTGNFNHGHGDVEEPDNKVSHVDNPYTSSDDSHDGHDHGTDISHAGHDHSAHGDEGTWNWINITFLIVSLIALFIVTTVPDHFLEEHLWGHVIKKHFFKIFLWTLGALIAVNLVLQYVDIGELVKTQHIYILLIAVLVGIIPESGPHLLFVTMFLYGQIPFSILIANSIVQDGHGALPLFAESKKSFLYMKLINVVVGFAVGLSGFFFGF